MVKHVIIWTLKDEYDETQKLQIKKDIKQGLEGLKGQIPGLINITVNIDNLESSNTDLMLDSEFEDFDALKGYSVHPEHVKIANTFVRPYTAIRSCFDFEV